MQNWNFQGDGGANKKPSMAEYGFFLILTAHYRNKKRIWTETVSEMKPEWLWHGVLYSDFLTVLFLGSRHIQTSNIRPLMCNPNAATAAAITEAKRIWNGGSCWWTRWRHYRFPSHTSKRNTHTYSATLYEPRQQTTMPKLQKIIPAWLAGESHEGLHWWWLAEARWPELIWNHWYW